MCVSCRKSKTVAGPRVRPNKSLKPSAVNSPPPEARSSAKPVLAGIFWPLFALSWSSVARKFRGRLLASFTSTSQINTGEPASARRIGGLFCTSVAEKLVAGVRSKTGSTYRIAIETDMKFITPPIARTLSNGQEIPRNNTTNSQMTFKVSLGKRRYLSVTLPSLISLVTMKPSRLYRERPSSEVCRTSESRSVWRDQSMILVIRSAASRAGAIPAR